MEQPPYGSTPNKLLKSLTCVVIPAPLPPSSIYIAMIEDPISLSSTATSPTFATILPLSNAAVLVVPYDESAVPNLFLKASKSKFCKPFIDPAGLTVLFS